METPSEAIMDVRTHDHHDNPADELHSPETRLELDLERTLIRIGGSGGVLAVGRTLIGMGYAIIGTPLVVIGILGILYFLYRFAVKEEFIAQIRI